MLEVSKMSVTINENVISSIKNVSMFTNKEKDTFITLSRFVDDNDATLNDVFTMNEVSLKIFDDLGRGYNIPTASVYSISTNLDMNSQFISQTLTLKTNSIKYSNNVASTNKLIDIEEEDYKNLINIIKKNKIKDKELLQKKPGFVHRTEPDLSVENEDLVWLNAQDPDKIKDEIKPRTLKKQNKHKKA